MINHKLFKLIKINLQTLLEECKYEITKNKMENLVNDDFDSSSKSDNESDSKSDNELGNEADK